MEKAGFFPLYVNELNNDALETYLVNREKFFPHLRSKYHSNDIKDVINELELKGYINDAEFTEMYAESLIKNKLFTS